MAFSAVVRRLLISCPGDVPTHDLEVVRKAVTRWNGIYGESFGSMILPVSWGMHAAAEFGAPPQDILNRQIVDRSDMCLALFANRLGTPTASAESGTAEEINRLSESGHYVAVLRSRRSVDPGLIDLDQAQRLQEYLHKISSNSLVLAYSTDDELSQHVEAVLAQAVTRDQGRVLLQLEQSSNEKAAEVWPRIDSAEEARTDTRGRLNTRRRWRLVLSNTGDAPARNVKFSIESDRDDGGMPWMPWMINTDTPDDEPAIEILAPHTEVGFGVFVTMGMGTQARCRVSWTDGRGRQENAATVRLG